MSSIKIQIIIPCYNEEKRLPLESYEEYLGQCSNRISLFFVNDGSKDNTSNLIQELCKKFPENTGHLDLQKNSGKAEAIRQGVMHILESNVELDYIGFMDADLSTPLTEISEMEKSIIAFNRPSMTFGSRVKLYGSTNISRSTWRHYIGRIVATFISRSLHLAIYDTQCGFKFIRNDRAKELFNQKFISRWLFDVELIFRLLQVVGRTNLDKEMFECPVKKWEEQGDSKIPLTYAFRIPFELMRIRRKYT